MTDSNQFHYQTTLSVVPRQNYSYSKKDVPKHLRLMGILFCSRQNWQTKYCQGTQKLFRVFLIFTTRQDKFDPFKENCHITLSHITSIITLLTINATLANVFKTNSHKNTFFTLSYCSYTKWQNWVYDRHMLSHATT